MNMNIIRTFHLSSSSRGQSLVEVALTFMIMLMLLGGAIDFGMALFSYVTIRDAAKEGAVYGSLNPTDTAGISANVRAAAPREPGQISFYPVDLSNASQVSVSVDWTDPTKKCEGVSGGVSNGVIVTVGFDYPISMPLVSKMIGHNTIPLRAIVTDTILTPVCP